MDAKEKLNYELKLKTYECEMLNNTLMQMYDKNSEQSSIDKVRSEVIAKMEEVSKIREEINKLLDKEEAVEYSFYDSHNEEPSGFYDSIVKNKKPYEKPTKDELSKVASKLNIRNEINKLSFNDSMLSSNLFLVDLSSICVDSNKVGSVSFDNRNKRVFVLIYDFMANAMENRKVPILSIINSKMKFETPFSMSISHIDGSGKKIYTEKYNGAKIINVERGELSYDHNDFSTIELEICYANVNYEADC